MRPVFASLPSWYLVIGLLGLLAGWWLVMRWRRAAGTWRLRYYAFPRKWLKYLHEHVPLYPRLPWELRAPYQDRVLHFVDAKGFRACGALSEIDEAARVTIAGNACALLLNGSGENYPDILAVQLFPRGDPNAAARSGSLALHWDGERRLATDPRDAESHALPEIAARLGWVAGGRPAIPDTLLLTAWARARSGEFVREHPGLLERAAGLSNDPAADGAEPADIFAVATEMFFGVPALLQQRQPELYGALRLFYRVDPARWSLNS